MKLIRPDWSPGIDVGAFSTTRHGGVSRGRLAGLNLGVRNGDDAACVAENRARLRRFLPADPCWLDQVHGCRVIHLDEWHEGVVADAAWSDRPGQVAVVQTADCLPILLVRRGRPAVAAIHAGWRGLAAGIIAETLAAMSGAGDLPIAWIGPSVCARCYQVGGEVREAFVAVDEEFDRHFQADGDRWRADLKAIAAAQLSWLGAEVHDCGRCTMCEPRNFYSFRRDGPTGNLASLIWLE
ncbi:MAG: peptidoglycan editing factor PgeF [Wenzhouxiangella sp.]